MQRAVVHLVRDINARRLDWNLVVGVARMYQMPCQWVSSDAYTLELVLQDKEGDRIQCSIPHESVSIFESLIQENSIYSMCNFIVKDVRSGLRVTSHEYKLGFYEKTSVRRLPSDEFPFSPFRFTPFPVIEAMCSRNNIFLIDCMGQVVGREDPEDIITNTGQSSKRLRLYLEDGEKNKMKCTFFGDFVDQALRYLEQKDVEPLVIVAQLFKPHVYLSDVNVQASLYGSRVLFNPSFPAVVEFRDRLLTLGEEFTQPISHVESQGQRSVTDEISSGEFPLRTVEEVLNMTEPCSCWILASIVSIDGGRDGWFYASCKGCFKKVIPKNDLYHCGECGQHGNKPPLKYCLKVIVNDFTGCLNLLLWNPEGSLIVGKSATEVRAAGKTEKDSCHPKILEEIIEKKFLFKISVSGQNISSGDSFYSVSKISDDDAMIEQYSSQAALMEHGVVDQSLSNAVPVDVDVVVESEIDANGGAVVSLSKDSCTESNFESCLDTPIRGKGTVTSSKMGG